jgi:O-acetyl-ADP-ribose deacetylase (regulator of RNase III)
MKIYLRDRNPEMAEAWNTWFKGAEDVEISCGDIFDGPKTDAIVSPANSFGWMEGGIDLAYSQKFGWDLQARLQKLLKEEHYGELPVGQAVIVSTNHKDYPWLVSAPTMRMPLVVVGTVNAHLAFRAALIAVKKHNATSQFREHQIDSILCPGLGTSIGRMPYGVCAKQMFYSYMTVVKGEQKNFANQGDCLNMHYSLTRDS